MAALDPEYYDILLLGRTGTGKSTAGNKMLGLSQSTDTENRFLQADDLEDPSQRCLSVTKQCKVLTSEQPVLISEDVHERLRILDVPGFADSSVVCEGVTIFEANLHLIRKIISIQMKEGLQFRRIVYFLPGRGALEKADSIFQEELKVMYHYFGKSIFEYMVLAGTFPPTSRFQREGIEFENEDIAITQETFQTTMTLATGDREETLPCPPVVYIGHTWYSGSKLVKDICSAPVQCDSDGLKLEIQDDVCARCSNRIWIATVNGKDGEKKTGVADGDDKGIATLKCHPVFKSKYSKTTKAIGGFVHVFTLGVPYFVAKTMRKKIWPGFTNSDEICVLCEQSPGAVGCMRVGQTVSINNVTSGGTKEIEIQHTNQL